MLGTRLKAVRNRKGMSQGQVAEYTGVAQSTLSDLERGEIAPKTIGALINLAEYFGCSVDYLLGTSNDFSPAANRSASEAALDAINLIDSLPPEKRTATVAVLRAMIELMEVGVPLPEPVESRDGGGGGEIKVASTQAAPTWEVGAGKKNHRQLGLPNMEEPSQADLDRRLALIKKMVPADVYEYIVQLVERGRPLSEADILYLLDASEHKPLSEIIQRFENNHTINDG